MLDHNPYDFSEWDVQEMEDDDHCRGSHSSDRKHMCDSYIEGHTGVEPQHAISPTLSPAIKHKPLRLPHNINYLLKKYIHHRFTLKTFRQAVSSDPQYHPSTPLLPLEPLSYHSGAMLEDSQSTLTHTMPHRSGGHFIMRIQSIYVVLSRRRSRQYLLDRNMVCCPHTTRWCDANRMAATQIFDYLEHDEVVQRNSKKEFLSYRCPYCPTETSIVVCSFVNEGRLLVVTKWLDLGKDDRDLLNILVDRGKKVETWSESPRDVFGGTESKDGSEFVSKEDRRVLFELSRSNRARRRRAWNMWGWYTWDLGRYYPHFPPYEGGTVPSGRDKAPRS